MRQIGGFLFVIGLLAIVLNFVDRVPTVLVWIYQWGETPAWGIKIACVVLGGLLWLIGRRQESAGGN
ncbi:MAG: hypothetical protein ACRC6I_18740 [Paracoccaceae bacterium]